jgi:hypothetical protein
MTRRAPYARPVTATRLACIALAAAVIALAGGSAAGAQVCAPPAYPGDAAAREAIAQWMAHGAGVAMLPRELPVMGALVESSLVNRRLPDVDAAGFFQMRISVWNSGSYAGFPEHPEIQLQWFVDQALAARRKRIAAGAPDPVAVETDWGDWIADVLRPAENMRGRYQLRLDEARALIGAACVPAAGDVPTAPGSIVPAPAPPPDTIAPVVELGGDRRQRALHRGAIVLEVTCPAEICTAAATATLRLPRATRAVAIGSAPRVFAAGRRGTLRLALEGRVRARVRKALRSRPSLTAAVGLVAVDTAGNRAVRARRVRITG